MSELSHPDTAEIRNLCAVLKTINAKNATVDASQPVPWTFFSFPMLFPRSDDQTAHFECLTNDLHEFRISFRKTRSMMFSRSDDETDVFEVRRRD